MMKYIIYKFRISLHVVYTQYIAPGLQYILYIYRRINYPGPYHVDCACFQALHTHSYIHARSETTMEIVSGKR